MRQVAAMPAIPYLVIHGDKDQSVNKEKHSDRFVAEMRKLGRDIEYLEIPGMGARFEHAVSGNARAD
jgi:dipeptidyl aminopeptidase/acylaminoacyl peptidase